MKCPYAIASDAFCNQTEDLIDPAVLLRLVEKAQVREDYHHMDGHHVVKCVACYLMGDEQPLRELAGEE